MIIGIYGISSQSGRAFFADYLNKGYEVIGYTRPTGHGLSVLSAIRSLGGLYLERPANSNHEPSTFVPLAKGRVTSDLHDMVQHSDVIIIPIPSTAHVSAVKDMQTVGLKDRQVPIILSPSRSFASPYIWHELGNGYPIVCFSTCPYSCKAPKPEIAHIKRRKRTYIASLEGRFEHEQVVALQKAFPQAAFTYTPALTTLNNIGAVFHCATYLMNFEEINRSAKFGDEFSFYMDGIAARPEVGMVLEQIDQVRLQIANKIGIKTFGLKNNPREEIWRKLTNGLRALEEESGEDIDLLRRVRRDFTNYLNNSVISAPHWLDITYGVIRQEGESLSETIGRTPTYQKNSIPQLRYITEDVPTGLVPIEAMAKRFGIDCQVVTNIINMSIEIIDVDFRESGRNLNEYSDEYVEKYLKGERV